MLEDFRKSHQTRSFTNSNVLFFISSVDDDVVDAGFAVVVVVDVVVVVFVARTAVDVTCTCAC